ncbi:MAG: hypothetical protein FJ297_05965 [Planctomycetes bacterium]|nr:hypothetical protein [Planctomycetota bacterium]
MIPDLTKHFSQRGSVNAVPFKGLTQQNEPHCVFASIAGAVNHLMGYPVWRTAADLFQEWQVTNQTGITFDSVIPIAIVSIPGKLRYELPRERIKNNPPQVFLREIDSCLGAGGVAIISVEAFETPLRTSGLGCWHMLTIIDKAQNWYQVWDTNGLAGSITDTEILTSFSGYGIEFQGKRYPHTWFHRHDTHDCLLLWRA